MSAVPAMSLRTRRVTIEVTYEAADVDRAAETMDAFLSDEETDAILAKLDTEFPAIAAEATRAAVGAWMTDELRQMLRMHDECGGH